jgi:uncharacterized protein
VPRFDRDPRAEGPLVQGVGPTGFTVDGGIYRGLLLTPLRADGWDPPALADLGIADFERLLALKPGPEFLILGTGAAIIFPPRTLRNALDQRGIGLEVMDSRAGARTWGVLRAEGRWIAAALMPL